MRARTTEFIKVLNRARPEPKTTEKKTITYVNFLDDPNLAFPYDINTSSTRQVLRIKENQHCCAGPIDRSIKKSLTSFPVFANRQQ